MQRLTLNGWILDPRLPTPLAAPAQVALVRSINQSEKAPVSGTVSMYQSLTRFALVDVVASECIVIAFGGIDSLKLATESDECSTTGDGSDKDDENEIACVNLRFPLPLLSDVNQLQWTLVYQNRVLGWSHWMFGATAADARNSYFDDSTIHHLLVPRLVLNSTDSELVLLIVPATTASQLRELHNQMNHLQFPSTSKKSLVYQYAPSSSSSLLPTVVLPINNTNSNSSTHNTRSNDWNITLCNRCLLKEALTNGSTANPSCSALSQLHGGGGKPLVFVIPVHHHCNFHHWYQLRHELNQVGVASAYLPEIQAAAQATDHQLLVFFRYRKALEQALLCLEHTTPSSRWLTLLPDNVQTNCCFTASAAQWNRQMEWHLSRMTSDTTHWIQWNDDYTSENENAGVTTTTTTNYQSFPVLTLTRPFATQLLSVLQSCAYKPTPADSANDSSLAYLCQKLSECCSSVPGAAVLAPEALPLFRCCRRSENKSAPLFPLSSVIIISIILIVRPAELRQVSPRQINECLDALLAQSYPYLQLILLLQQSSDEHIAADGNTTESSAAARLIQKRYKALQHSLQYRIQKQSADQNYRRLQLIQFPLSSHSASSAAGIFQLQQSALPLVRGELLLFHPIDTVSVQERLSIQSYRLFCDPAVQAVTCGVESQQHIGRAETMLFRKSDLPTPLNHHNYNINKNNQQQPHDESFGVAAQHWYALLPRCYHESQILLRPTRSSVRAQRQSFNKIDK
jgi:hypothetical protein